MKAHDFMGLFLFFGFFRDTKYPRLFFDFYTQLFSKNCFVKVTDKGLIQSKSSSSWLLL